MGIVIVDKKLNEAVTLAFMRKISRSGIYLKDHNIPESEAVTSLHQSL